MTEHLPECWAKHDSDPPAWCICDELRACEQRVRKDEQSHFLTRYLLGRNGGGYRRGLDAANLAYERGVKAGYAAGYVEAVSTAQCLLEEHVDSRGWVALTKMMADVPALGTVQR